LPVTDIGSGTITIDPTCVTGFCTLGGGYQITDVTGTWSSTLFGSGNAISGPVNFAGSTNYLYPFTYVGGTDLYLNTLGFSFSATVGDVSIRAWCTSVCYDSYA